MSAAWFLLAAGAATAVRAIFLSLDAEVPWGTLTVNLGGSLILGLVVGADAATPAVAIGGLGALTTWSALIVGLVERRDAPSRVVFTLGTSLVGGIGLAYLGLQVAG